MRRAITFVAAQWITIWAVGGLPAYGQAPNSGRAPAPRGAQAAPAAEERPENRARMERLLQLWERQSSLLKTLDVAILRIDVAPAWDELEYYEGRAIFKSPNYAFIDFNKIQQDAKKKPVRDPKDPRKWASSAYERIVCTGEEVWQYRSDVKQIFIFPLEKDQQQKAIEEGPLPFLFNMRADDAKKRYDMTLESEDEKSYHVSIRPKLDVDRESFSKAFVQLDRKYLLPTRIMLVSPDLKSSKEFRLSGVKPNQPVSDKNFKGVALGPPWKVVRNPAGEEPPRAGAPRQRGAAAGQPTANRPAAPSQGQRR